MFKKGMDDRGQLSAEYFLLIVVILVIFGYMLTHFVGPTIDASNDVSKVADAHNAVNSIADAVNLIYANGPMAKRTLQIYLPTNMTIVVNSSGVSTNVILSDGTVKTETAQTSYPMINNTYNNLTKGTHTVTLRWSQTAGVGSGIV